MPSFPAIPLQNVSVEELAWIAGAWRGTIGDDTVEEIWSPPLGATMMGMFRWLRDGKPRFYEAIVLEPEDSGVTMRIKHLTPGTGLKSWEEQGESTDFFLCELGPNHAVFAERGEEGTWLMYDREENRLKVEFASAAGTPKVKSPFLFSRT